MRILVVEDDPILSDGLRVGLGLCGFTVDTVSTCDEARAAFLTGDFDAVVLDVMLPDGSGLELLQESRSREDQTPILVLTARDAPADRVHGLDTGADDYLGKPFDLDELAARLRALLRRSSGRAEPLLRWKDVSLDPARQVVHQGGKPVALSRRELTILQTLMERPGVVFSKSQLEERLYGWQEDVESNVVEVHIHKLRAKLGGGLIETVRGLGYRLAAM
ncbi:response regulator [Indioceanicola profundi]|uniref:response regulator n=1 Tax=Indioceanicola profundi TaxID=2220096 RepID=UPI000E6A983E|nr:response regulator transcription factor [Indioceanicola profundi]